MAEGGSLIPATESKKCAYNRRLAALRSELATWLPHYRDISEVITPRTTRFLSTDRNKGNKRNTKIIDNTAGMALRTLCSGLMSGVTNPARPWLQFTTSSAEINEIQTVKVWLEQVRDRIMKVFLKSNLYTTLPQCYEDLGAYGTAAFFVMPDEEAVFRCYHLPCGSYMLGLDGDGRVDTCYREYEQTVKQLVDEFGFDACSISTQNLFRNGNLDTWVPVVHVVQPNAQHDSDKIDPTKMKFVSDYYETNDTTEGFLKQSGFNSFAVIAPRWKLTGEDVYGTSPAMEALGDVLGLQIEQKRKVQLIEKHVNPPMTAPTSLRNKEMSSIAGGVTFVDTTTGQGTFAPAYQTTLQGLNYLSEDIKDLQGRIRTAFFADLFLMISNDQRSGVTAYERQIEVEEKMLALGPVYLRLNDEMLDPLAHCVYQMLIELSLPYWRGLINGDPILPPPPPELMGLELTIEYISIMAQAMKAIGVTSIERTFNFAGSLSQAFPEVLDVLDPTEGMIAYAEMNGTAPKLVRDKKVVAQIRDQRAKDTQAAQAMEMAKQGSETAKNMAGVPMGDSNAMSQILQRMGTQTQGVA